MIVPYIAAITYDVCQAVPRSQREGALAVGATRWQTIWKRRAALRPARHHRRLLPGPGPGPRRDDGRHHAHRQHGPRSSLSPFAPGDTIPSVIATSTCNADHDCTAPS